MASEVMSGPVEEPNLDQKKATVTSKLQKRQDVRVADLQKRKDEKENESAENESAQYFHENFTKCRGDIEAGLDSTSATIGKASLIDHFDGLVVSLQHLQKFLTDSAMFLTSYEVQRSQEVLSRLQSDIQDKRDEMVPKKKFAFRSKKKAAENQPTERNKILSGKDSKIDITVELTETRFTDMSGKSLEKSAGEIDKKDVALARLDNCTVMLYGSACTLHATNLKNCVIFCGPVSSSIFVDGCTSCTFIVACQQLRTHSTTDSAFYLHVTSRAIIEDCTGLVFAPYNWDYAEMENHYTLSGLDKSRNHWDDVDDFNWLASDAHSPNWSILEEDKRISTWDAK